MRISDWSSDVCSSDLLTSRFRANHPLKACPACMTKDLDDHQTTYWRLDHQFPGVWHCPVHGEDYAAKAIRRASEIFSVPSGSVRAIAVRWCRTVVGTRG